MEFTFKWKYRLHQVELSIYNFIAYSFGKYGLFFIMLFKIVESPLDRKCCDFLIVIYALLCGVKHFARYIRSQNLGVP